MGRRVPEDARRRQHREDGLADARHHRAHVDLGRDEPAAARRAARDRQLLQLAQLLRLALRPRPHRVLALRTAPPAAAHRRRAAAVGAVAVGAAPLAAAARRVARLQPARRPDGHRRQRVVGPSRSVEARRGTRTEPSLSCPLRARCSTRQRRQERARPPRTAARKAEPRVSSAARDRSGKHGGHTQGQGEVCWEASCIQRTRQAQPRAGICPGVGSFRPMGAYSSRVGVRHRAQCCHPRSGLLVHGYGHSSGARANQLAQKKAAAARRATSPRTCRIHLGGPVGHSTRWFRFG